MRKILSHTIHLFLLIALPVAVLNAKSDKAALRVEDVIWANGEIYSTILTGNSFKMPPMHSVDILFNFDDSGLMGQRPVSDAAPGDKHYNGGRWAVHLVTFTEAGMAAHDPDNDGYVNFELKSAEMIKHHIMLGHITVTPVDVYFTCPLVR